MSLKNVFKIGFSLLVLALFTFSFSCDDDDKITDVNNPEFTEFVTNISSAPGHNIVFVGTITDDQGIDYINLTYSNWHLDRYIDFNDPPEIYNLNYTFLVPEDEEPLSHHVVQVAVTDLSGNTTTYDVVVSLDLDVTDPEVEIVSPIAGTGFNIGDLVQLDINLSDDFGLQSLQINSELLGLDEVVNITDGETSFNYTSEIEIPDGLDGAVIIEVVATDNGGNTSTATTTILIGSDSQYTDIYIVGGSAWWEWDPTKAMKMWQDPNDENWFVSEFYYWTGYDIKFIGQLDWEPFNWGLDPNDNTQIINSQDSEAIGFTEGDGYYRVRFNPYSLEYEYETMTVNIEERDNMYLMGKGFVGYSLDWNPADAIPMDKDGWGWGNPYMFTIQVEFSEAVDLKFIGQNDGWGPYDCGFENGGEMTLPLNYVKNECGDGTADVKFTAQPGSYWIVYDYYLLRTAIQPAD